MYIAHCYNTGAAVAIAVNPCGIKEVNSVAVSLGAGTYVSIGLKAAGGVGTALASTQVTRRPTGNGPNTVNRTSFKLVAIHHDDQTDQRPSSEEHIFE